MENDGKLLEAWVCTCARCGDIEILHWNNGTDMSKSQARRLLQGDEYGWEESDRDGWICKTCLEDAA